MKFIDLKKLEELRKPFGDSSYGKYLKLLVNEKINKTFIKDLLVIEPQLFKDDRGFFYESYNKNNLDKVVNVVFVQDNESKSSKGVIRGLHFKTPTCPNKTCKMCFWKNFRCSC